MSLEGLRIGVTSHRKAPELIAALERAGARVRHGPTVGGDVPVPDDEIVADTDAILDASPHWIVASTGVGMRLWADAAGAHGRLDGLLEAAARARCVARGPKATGGLQALGVRPVWSSQRQTDADVSSWLAAHAIAGDVVAVQLHGSAATPAAFAAVARVGADVMSVATYRHEPPADLEPARALIAMILDGVLDVVVFTSPGAARNLIAIAAQQGAEDAVIEALQGQVATAVIGPVTASALEETGIPAWITPTRHRTGDLLRTLGTWAARRRDADVRPALQLLSAASAVRTPTGVQVDLGERSFAVLAVLARRPGVVCTPQQLLVEAWGHVVPADPSAIKHHIARLRRKLDGTGVQIHTVRGAGYRLEAAERP